MLNVSAKEWGTRLGLTATHLFGFEGQDATGEHLALLNGVKGSFLLSKVARNQDQSGVADYNSWSWSSNIRHHVTICENSVFVSSPSMRGRDQLSLDQVDRQLEKFFSYLEADKVNFRVSVADHLLGTLRRHLAAPRNAIGTAVPRFEAFLALLADELFDESSGQTQDFFALASMDANIIDAISSSYRAQFRDELRIEAVTNMRLSLPLALRHAGGALFQETHAELVGSDQLTLFGLPEASKKSINLASGAYYTPPGLARAIADIALGPHLDRDAISILDPACGSGIFLCEALRSLQRVGFSGRVKVIGLDIDPNAVAMARFSLACASLDWPGHVEFDIRCGDFLQTDISVTPDVVVMNPPFKKWELMNALEREALASELGKLHQGRPDLSMGFITKVLRLLSDGGTLGTLLPLGVLSSQSALKWRNDLAKHTKLKFISSLGDHALFANAIVSVTALVAERGQATDKQRTTLLWSSERPRAASEALRKFRQIDATANGREQRQKDWAIYQVQQHDFQKRKVWLPLPNSIGSLLSRLTHSMPGTVETYFDVLQGIRTGHREAFVFTDKVVEALPAKEREYFQPVAENQTIYDGELHRGVKLFRGELLGSVEELEQKCPQFLQRHLLQHRDQLQQRSGIDPEKWWMMTRSRPKQKANYPKIVGKMFGGVEAFGLDLDGVYAVVQGNVWAPRRSISSVRRDGEELPSEFFASVLSTYTALLNSEVFFLLVREFSVLVAGGQYELAPKYVSDIPLPNLADMLLEDPRLDAMMIAVSSSSGESRKDARNALAAYAYGTTREDWPLDRF